jgi:multisubunit Na+/H+ antiporter MnhG subunit
MPKCDEVRLLLGPFDDGELEPQEMEDVAFHVVSCGTCKATLDDYRSLGVGLRDCLPQPAIDGFASIVLNRIDEIRQPLRVRCRLYLDAIAAHIGGTVSLMAVGAFAALLTAWLITPYAQHFLHRSSNLVQMASRNENNVAALNEQNADVNQNTIQDASTSSMITLSNDPTTTVIWVPSQP